MSDVLRKLLRRGAGRAVEQALTGARLDDLAGAIVLGDPAAQGERHPVLLDGEPVGSVVGPAALGVLIGQIATLERDRRALADETLGRYKELALLYDLSEKLSSLLDLDAVARLVVDESRRHLKATDAALLLTDERTGVLRAAAAVGVDGLDDPLTARVFATGRSDLANGARAALCAPLRAGERVFGVLYVAHEGGAWTAGDLKLVAALAANAAAALSSARLHAERVRELALRHHVERHVSPRLLEAAFDGPPPPDAEVAVALCDLRGLAALAPPDAPDRLLSIVETGVVAAVHAFLAHGAAVDTPRGELVVGVFATPAAARHAAADLTGRLASRGMGGLAGVGIAAVPAAQLARGINAAAVLQSESAGGIRTAEGAE